VSPTLTSTAQAAVDSYLDQLSRALPDAVSGVYLTGSAALGDWQEGRSDLDLLTLTDRPLAGADLDALADLHSRLSGRPYRDAIYAQLSEAGRPGSPDTPGLPHVIDGGFSPAGYAPDPVLWATLDRHGITLTGPPAGHLGASPDPGWLRDWNRGNLQDYWGPWAAGFRARVTELDRETFDPEVVSWGLLGPGRLHCTITTGAIVSKTGSADYTAEHFPAYADLLARARAWRLGDDSVRFSKAGALDAADLIDAIVASAAAAAAAR
jgi:hypothetical protein